MFPDSWMFPDSSHSGYSDSQGVYTTGEFGFLGTLYLVQCFHFKFPIQKSPDSWRNQEVLIPDSCFLSKRQNVSRTKTFYRIRHESENIICSSINVVLVAELAYGLANGGQTEVASQVHASRKNSRKSCIYRWLEPAVNDSVSYKRSSGDWNKFRRTPGRGFGRT